MMHQINLPLINNHIFWIMILLPFQFNFFVEPLFPFCWKMTKSHIFPFFLPRLLIFLILVQTLWSKLFIVERCYQVPLPEISKDLSYCGKDILHWKFGNLKLLISELYYCIDFNFWKRAIRHLFSCHWALFYGNFMMNKKWQSNPLYERLAVTLGWHETIKK